MKKAAVILSLPVFLLTARFFPFERLPSVCAFYTLTHLPCPTCGMTRSVIALTHFDLYSSLMFNLLGLPFLIVFAVAWVTAVYQLYTGRQTRLAAWTQKHMFRLVLTGLIIVVIFGIIRIILIIME